MLETDEIANDLFKQAEWVMLGTDWCKWCEKTKELLAATGRSFYYCNVDIRPDVKDWLKAQDLRTIPQVYHSGTRIGGYEALEKYINENA